MSYQDDPNINRRNRIDREDTSYTGWIIGGIVALALVVGIFVMFGRDNTSTASNNTPNRPTATAPITTGSGSGGTTSGGSGFTGGTTSGSVPGPGSGSGLGSGSVPGTGGGGVRRGATGISNSIAYPMQYPKLPIPWA